MKNIFKLIKKSFIFLNKKSKIKLIILVFITLFASLIETIGLILLVSFIKLASNTSIVHKNQYLDYLYNHIHFNNEINFIIFLGIWLLLFYIVRTLFVYKYIKILNFYLLYIQKEISLKIFNYYINENYESFKKIETNTIKETIKKNTIIYSNYIKLLINSLNELIVSMFIFALLIYMDWKITIFIILFVILLIFIILKRISIEIKKKGKSKHDSNIKYNHFIDDVIYNFKTIKIYKKEEKFSKIFKEVSKNFFNDFISLNILQRLPKLILENFSFILVTLIILYMLISYKTDLSEFIGIFSLFIISFYKLLPSFNILINNFNHITSDLEYIKKIITILDTNKPKHIYKEISIKKNIEYKNIEYNYDLKNKDKIFKINLKIDKGDKIAIIGESGSGKTTFLNIITGLYKQTSGHILIDSKEATHEDIINLSYKIGYVPQESFILSGTVLENITLKSKSDSNINKVKEVLKKVNLLNFFNSFDGLNTKIGENGIELSGGQRQRISIARALYKEFEIIVLDEPTSALDPRTAKEIMDYIYSLYKNKTLIVITHNYNMIKEYDKIYEIKNKELKAI